MIRVYTSSIIDAPCDAVWSRLRNKKPQPQ